MSELIAFAITIISLAIEIASNLDHPSMSLKDSLSTHTQFQGPQKVQCYFR